MDNKRHLNSELVTNQLFYGDNLEILRDQIPNECVDLIYLDPPFNSNRSYNILFKNKSGDQAAAQIEAFDDTWVWSQQTEELFTELVTGGSSQKIADALIAMRRLLGDNDVLAYLVMMTARLIELHRVLKQTGSLYLHCDPTASHYLKVMMDAIFGPTNFKNEIIWKRSHGHNSAGRFGRNHDVILFYGKGKNTVWNKVFQDYNDDYIKKHYRHVDPVNGKLYKRENPTGAGISKGVTGQPWRGIDPTSKGRHWAKTPDEMDKLDAAGLIYWPKKAGAWPYIKLYLEDMEGVPAQDTWSDIDPINMRAAERLGYPTQKPIALLERIIEASSNPGDIVLDPFCGCGTTIDAAQKMDRQWVGIDVTYLAIDLIERRLERTYGEEIKNSYTLSGVPKDLNGAQALFDNNPFDFERWAVTLVDGQPNEKQVGDKGIDGVIRFNTNPGEYGSVIVSVKGGKTVNPAMVRELDGTVTANGAEMGLLITITKPTKGMRDAAQHTGSYTYELSGHTYPKVQLITIEELLNGKKVNMPTPLLPYKLAKARSGQATMF